MFFKHHRNIEEFVTNAIKYLGVEYQGSEDKYDIIEKAKTQFMNFIATKMYINLGSKETPFYTSMGIDENIKASYDIKLPGGNVVTKSLYGLPAFTHLLVNRLNALAKHLSTTGKDNYFLSNLEFYFDSSSNMNKIIFTQDKMQDAVESSKFKRAFLELANEDIKAWEEGTRKQKWGEGQQYSYTQHLLLQYLMLVEGTDYGRTSFSDVIPDSMYEDLSWALEDTVKQFIAPNTKNLSEQERLAALEEYGNTNVTQALEKIKDQFILQFALNNNNQLKNLDIDKGKIKTSMFLEDGRYYDLIVPSTVRSNFIAYGSGVYYRSSFDKDNSYFTRVGFRNKGKVFFLSEEIFSNGFSLNKVFDGTYFIYSQNLQGNVYTSAEFKEKKPFKVGQPVYIKYAGDLTYTKVRKATITKVEEIENEGKFQYKLTITTPTTSTIVDTAKISGLGNNSKLGRNLEFTDRSTKQSAIINLYSQIGTNYSLRDRLQELINNTTSDFIRNNAKKLLNTLSSNQLDNTSTIIDPKLKPVGRVNYGDVDTSYDYSISLNPKEIKRRRDYELALLHEAYHIATMTSFNIMDFSKSSGTISEGLQSLYFEISNIYEIAKTQVTDSDFRYYFINIHEFISGAFSDAKFAYKLKKVNLWTRLVN
jgi:hypothetical protein